MENTLSDVEMLNILNKIVPEKDLQTIQVKCFLKECIEMVQLYAKKNHDYGNSFVQGMDVMGVTYGVGRLYDKMNRIIALTNGKQTVKTETINDTLQDLACYSVMLNCYYKTTINAKVMDVSFEGE